MRTIVSLCAFVLLLSLAGSPCAAVFIDFESGMDDTAVGTISGLTFNTPSGFDLVYHGVDNGDNALKSDNGKQSNEDWEYWISGDFGAISKDENTAIITFSQPMAYFQVGYSSYFPFVLEAYDSGDTMVAWDSGTENSREWGGTGLGYLDVEYTGMSYVKLFGDMGQFPEGGYWVIDNVRAEVIPEWPTAALALAGLPWLMLRRKAAS